LPLPARAALLALAAGISPPSTAGATPPRAIAPGTLLVATARMHDADFQRTVILIVESDSHAARGVLLTRESGFRWTQLFPALAGTAAAREPLYLGGFVAQGVSALEYVPATRQCPECLCGALRPLSDPAVIEARARRAPATLRVYAGYMGWSAEQLAAELAAGLWSTRACAADPIWRTPPERLWQRLSTPRR
jgi:putative transcriptional regulator